MAELPRFATASRYQELRRLCDSIERDAHTWSAWRMLVAFWQLRRAARRLEQVRRRQARVLAR